MGISLSESRTDGRFYLSSHPAIRIKWNRKTIKQIKQNKKIQIESRTGLRCTPRNPNPGGKRIIPDRRLTEFPTLSVNLRVGISRLALDSDY